MGIHLKVLTPFAAAFLYSVAGLMLKQAMAKGSGSWRVIFLTNWMYVLVFLPFCFWDPTFHCSSVRSLVGPLLTGAALFSGQVFAYKAIQIGDVSVQSPVMGTKILLVALFSVLLGASSVSGLLWVAAGITVVAIYFLTKTPAIRREKIRTLKTAGLALLAAASFGISEVLMEKQAAQFGEMTFLFLAMLISGFISFSLVPWFEGPLFGMPCTARKWAVGGSFLMAVEAAMLYAGIAHYGGATQANLIYSSRGVWTIALIWLIGRWFGNTEKERVGPSIMLQRLIGACLLILTIVCVLKQG